MFFGAVISLEWYPRVHIAVIIVNYRPKYNPKQFWGNRTLICPIASKLGSRPNTA